MAILTKAQLEALNQSSFPDQSTEAITPAILRTYNTATIDTLVDSLDTGSFTTDAEFNAFTSSTNSSITQLNSATASIQSQLATIGTQSGSWGAGGTSQVTSASFNAYTASTDSSISQLNASSASQQISINALNTNSGSVNSSITQLNASSASQQISINNLNTTTSSLNTSASLALTTASFSGNTLTFTKGNGTTFGVVIPDVSGSTIPAGTVSSSAQIVNYGIFATTGSNQFIGNQAIDGALTITGKIIGSQSIILQPDTNDVRTLEIYNTSATDTHITASGGNLFLGNDETYVLVTTYANQKQVTIRGDEKITASGSLDISGSLSASLEQGYVWVGNGNGRTVTVATSSFTSIASGSVPAGTVSSSAQILAYNIFATTGSNQFIGSQTIKSNNGTPLILDHSDATPTQNTLLAFFKSGSAEWSIGNLGTDDSFILYNPTTFQTPISVAQNNSVTLLGTLTASLQQGYAYVGDGSGKTSAVATSSFSTTIPAGTISGSSQITSLGFVSSSVTASSLVTASFSGNTLTFTKGDSSTFGVVIPDISGSTINTGSFATTGSNVFTGDQTFTDEAGNTVTLSDISGSLVLVAKGSTSGSAGLSNITSSASTQVNLIFKSATTQSGSLTISGSNNILTSPSPATAGFVRYVSNNNIALNSNFLPQITGSAAYSPNVSSNLLNGQLTFRGPASSSAWNLRFNTLQNAALSIGSADATSANQAIAGGTMDSNILLSTVNYNAYTTPLSASAGFSRNLAVGIDTTLTAFSSSIQANSNIFNGNTFTVNNSYYGTASTNAAQRLGLSFNVLGGINSSRLTASGSNTTAAAPREVIGNTTNGSGILLGVVLNGDNSNLYSTLVHGSNLTVTGSSAYNTYQTAGGAFIGRNNSVNGTAASSGETIFAVGTGTSTSVRKTGFLIDSGSNTFIEGTLNVSGSTSFNGAVNITGSLTSSLTQGYVWVGGAGNISTLVATSSFAGGSVPAGTVSSSAQITALGFVSSSVTASSLVTASVNLNTITFTKGDASTFAITVNTGSGGGSVPAGTVSSSAQILNYNIFATTGSNNFVGNQSINGDLTITNNKNLTTPYATITQLSVDGGLGFSQVGNPSDTQMSIQSANKTSMYCSATSVDSGYNSGSSFVLNVTTGSNAYGYSGSADFNMTAQWAGKLARMQVNSSVGTDTIINGLAENISFAGISGTPNTPSNKFSVEAKSIELSGSIKVNTGTSGSAGIVNIADGGTVTNGLVTGGSIILLTTQQLGGGNEYPAVVASKTNGSFVINHNYGSNLDVAYLIINPI